MGVHKNYANSYANEQYSGSKADRSRIRILHVSFYKMRAKFWWNYLITKLRGFKFEKCFYEEMFITKFKYSCGNVHHKIYLHKMRAKFSVWWNYLIIIYINRFSNLNNTFIRKCSSQNSNIYAEMFITKFIYTKCVQNFRFGETISL